MLDRATKATKRSATKRAAAVAVAIGCPVHSRALGLIGLCGLLFALGMGLPAGLDGSGYLSLSALAADDVGGSGSGGHTDDGGAGGGSGVGGGGSGGSAGHGKSNGGFGKGRGPGDDDSDDDDDGDDGGAGAGRFSGDSGRDDNASAEATEAEDKALGEAIGAVEPAGPPPADAVAGGLPTIREIFALPKDAVIGREEERALIANGWNVR